MTSLFVGFERGDILLAPFKYTDMDVYKKRPVLVLSHSALFGETGQVVVAMITSASASNWPLDVICADWQLSGLNGPCLVRMKLTTFDESQIIKWLGRIDAATQSTVSQNVAKLLI
jgi:mRNA interferase MazF